MAVGGAEKNSSLCAEEADLKRTIQEAVRHRLGEKGSGSIFRCGAGVAFELCQNVLSLAAKDCSEGMGVGVFLSATGLTIHVSEADIVMGLLGFEVLVGQRGSMEGQQGGSIPCGGPGYKASIVFSGGKDCSSLPQSVRLPSFH